MKIDVEELTLQIKLALQDVFDANVSQDERAIKMLFDNGQEFLIEIIEK